MDKLPWNCEWAPDGPESILVNFIRENFMDREYSGHEGREYVGQYKDHKRHGARNLYVRQWRYVRWRVEKA